MLLLELWGHVVFFYYRMFVFYRLCMLCFKFVSRFDFPFWGLEKQNIKISKYSKTDIQQVGSLS